MGTILVSGTPVSQLGRHAKDRTGQIGGMNDWAGIHRTASFNAVSQLPDIPGQSCANSAFMVSSLIA